MRIKNSLFALICSPVIAFSSLVETSTLDEVLIQMEHLASSDTLVIFDIDNTLIESAHQLGSVAYVEELAENFEKKGFTKEEAGQIADIVWIMLQRHVDVKLVDPNAPSIIQEIKNRDIPVLCLTARDPVEIRVAREQLNSVGINPGFKSIKSKQILLQSHLAIYDDGIIFAGTSNKKSDALVSFLDRNQLQPKHIIFVDDKKHHVEDVQKTLEGKGIHCVGIRYGGADMQRERFNREIAEMQWKMLPKSFSDEEASRILNN